MWCDQSIGRFLQHRIGKAGNRGGQFRPPNCSLIRSDCSNTRNWRMTSFNKICPATKYPQGNRNGRSREPPVASSHRKRRSHHAELVTSEKIWGKGIVATSYQNTNQGNGFNDENKSTKRGQDISIFRQQNKFLDDCTFIPDSMPKLSVKQILKSEYHHWKILHCLMFPRSHHSGRYSECFHSGMSVVDMLHWPSLISTSGTKKIKGFTVSTFGVIWDLKLNPGKEGIRE